MIDPENGVVDYFLNFIFSDFSNNFSKSVFQIMMLWLSTSLHEYVCWFSFLIVADWSTQVIKHGRKPKQLIHSVKYLKLVKLRYLRNLNILII